MKKLDNIALESLLSDEPPTSDKSALHSILSWSADRPMWQRDALRRIISKGALDQIDHQELENLFRNGPQAVDMTGAPLVPLALASEHLPETPTGTQAVSIHSIGNLQHVNRLLAGQTLSFGTAPGLTVVYGDNGSGKSGYARVIKRACRTRGAVATIQSDVFLPAPPNGTKPCCDIAIQSAGAPISLTWTDGIAADARLANVFVFDTASAAHYLNANAPCTFTPYGLDVLPKLADMCDVLTKSVKGSLSPIEEQVQAGTKVLEAKFSKTKVGAALAKITGKTKKSDLVTAAEVMEQDLTRLSDLRALLTANAKEKALATRASKDRIEAFAKRIDARISLMSDAAIADLGALQTKAILAEGTAKIFSDAWNTSGALDGTGNANWILLWEAARKFSNEHAYQLGKFPNVLDDVSCVLCQQTLSEEAKQRLMKFEDFCRDESKKASIDAGNAFKSACAGYVAATALADAKLLVDADIAALKKDDCDALAAYIGLVDTILTDLQSALAKGATLPLTEVADFSTQKLNDLVLSLEERAKTEDSADDPATRLKLEQEKEEIEAKQWLATIQSQVEAQIDKLSKIETLSALLKGTHTGKITTASSELTQKFITENFCKRFNDELSELGLNTLAVKLEEMKGAKGKTDFGLRITGAAQSMALREVASEGEQRCIALALFLSELSTASHKSALVFDDPVSSLDHYHRERIARRLAKEAKDRQVIVFTHDTVFLNDLQVHAEIDSCPAEFRTIEWGLNPPGDSKPGAITSGLPWQLKTVSDRIDTLEKMQSSLKKSWGVPKPTAEQIENIGKTYSLLRATIERVVEREIFGNVVFRYRDYVNLKDLDKVVGFTQAECNNIQSLFKKACDVTDAHDPASGKAKPAPTPDDLLADINFLKSIVSDSKARAKGPM